MCVVRKERGGEEGRGGMEWKGRDGVGGEGKERERGGKGKEGRKGVQRGKRRGRWREEKTGPVGREGDGE